MLVKDIRPGINSSSPSNLTDINGTLFFTANGDTNGTELWNSDGTEAGTNMVKDIWPGPNGSSPSYLTDLNGTLLFSANDGSNGMELWKSDGTAANTILAKDIYIGKSNGGYYDPFMGYDPYYGYGMTGLPNSSNPYNLVIFKGMLVFSAMDPEGQELWIFDPH